MANIGIIKSKNSNREKTPIGGFFLVDFLILASGLDLSKLLNINLWFNFGPGLGLGQIAINDKLINGNLTKTEPNRASLNNF